MLDFSISWCNWTVANILESHFKVRLLQYVAGGAIRSTWCSCQTTCYPDKSRMQIMCLSEFAQTQCNAFMPCCHIIVKQWHKQGCIHSAFKPKAKRLQSIIDQKWKSRIKGILLLIDFKMVFSAGFQVVLCDRIVFVFALGPFFPMQVLYSLF